MIHVSYAFRKEKMRTTVIIDSPENSWREISRTRKFYACEIHDICCAFLAHSLETRDWTASIYYESGNQYLVLWTEMGNVLIK